MVLSTMYHTLTAFRNNEWVMCHFWPYANGSKVQVSYSWGSKKNVSVEEARNLWTGLKRKGWTVHNPVVEF